MKEDLKEKHVNKKRDRGQIFLKVMAGFLAILMLVAASSSVIVALL